MRFANSPLVIGVAFCAFASTAMQAQSGAQAAVKPGQNASQSTTIDVRTNTLGKEPTSFLPMVGNWVVVNDEGRRVVMSDGRAWKRGQPAGGLADKAREIYGSRHEDFIDNVKAFAYYPIAVAKGIDHFENGELSLRFKMIGGALDRCAGILFDVKPNGDYLVVRFNGTEDNLVLWTFNDGKRKFVKRAAQEIPLELGQWYDIKVAVHGTQMQASLNGKMILEYTLPAPVSGKVGLWTKTDSMSEFDGFTVTPSAK